MGKKDWTAPALSVKLWSLSILLCLMNRSTHWHGLHRSLSCKQKIYTLFHTLPMFVDGVTSNNQMCSPSREGFSSCDDHPSCFVHLRFGSIFGTFRSVLSMFILSFFLNKIIRLQELSASSRYFQSNDALWPKNGAPAHPKQMGVSRPG